MCAIPNPDPPTLTGTAYANFVNLLKLDVGTDTKMQYSVLGLWLKLQG